MIQPGRIVSRRCLVDDKGLVERGVSVRRRGVRRVWVGGQLKAKEAGITRFATKRPKEEQCQDFSFDDSDAP